MILLSPKPVFLSVITELTLKGRPAEEEQRFLLPLSVCQIWFSGYHNYWNRKFVSALKADGLI